jgi:hypothetical protein
MNSYAESQFLRLMGGAKYCVTRVDYVVNPALLVPFEDKQKEFEARGVNHVPVLAFHGTKDANIDIILKDNFQLSKLASNTGRV